MPDLAIVDTSCLIGLTAADVLGVLAKLYPQVVVPRAVAAEFGEALPSWLTVVDLLGADTARALRSSSLGAGEAEVIALALERPEAVAVLDDRRARQVAREMGVRFTGTAGVLLKAKSSGLLVSVTDTMDAMSRAGFRFSPDLQREVARLAKEAPDPK